MARPNQNLPLPPSYTSTEEYISDLLSFVSTHPLHRLLTGGVHILDFFTRTPSLYETLLEPAWREWFDLHPLDDLVYFILHEDVSQFKSDQSLTWRGKAAPPTSLVDYILDVRKLLLRREPASTSYPSADPSQPQRGETPKIPRAVATGMKCKKLHEVTHFASYVDSLAKSISADAETPITHLADFGSGQNYLGRTLASEPYNWNVVAVESKSHNVESARGLDVHAKLAPKKGNWVNKKEWRAQRENGIVNERKEELAKFNEHECPDKHEKVTPATTLETPRSNGSATIAEPQLSSTGKGSIQYIEQRLESGDLSSTIDSITQYRPQHVDSVSSSKSRHQSGQPSLMVISLHSCGNLSHHGIRSLLLNPSVKAVAIVGCCYNLLTESLTPASYKLPSLRPQPPSQPPPTTPAAQQTTATTPPSSHPPTPQSPQQPDPHGFPMSHRFRTHKAPTSSASSSPRGIHLNITARMMAVQAPTNWTPTTSQAFFTRHFYRALLQRVFLDCGIVEAHTAPGEDRKRNGWSAAGTSGTATVVLGSYAASRPVVVGSLRRACYTDFVRYVRGAVAKMTGHYQHQHQDHHDPHAADDGNGKDENLNETTASKAKTTNTTSPPTPAPAPAPAWAPPKQLTDLILSKTSHLRDADLAAYEAAYASRRKELGVVWTLMAFSAGVVEAAVVVDRWCWLRERMARTGRDGIGDGDEDEPPDTDAVDVRGDGEVGEVADAWVEAVWEYGQSPRNLVVVGVKK